MKKVLAFLAVSLALVGCSGTLPVQAGGVIERNSGTKVTTSVSSMNILGFTPMSMETAEQAISDLQAKCQGGKVTGVTSLVRQTTFIIVTSETFEVSGYCAE